MDREFESRCRSIELVLEGRVIEKVFIHRQVHDELIKLANKYSSKIVCGLLVGRREENKIIVEEHYVLPTRSGPKIHFKPNWSAYRSTSNIIHEQKKTIAGEFHTHPDGSEQLNINDRKILRKLGGGFWIIATPKRIIPWYFRVSYEKGRGRGYPKFSKTTKKICVCIQGEVILFGVLFLWLG